MGHYKSNLRDIEFNLFEVLGRDEVLGQGPYADMDLDTAREVLAEIDRLAKHELAESFAEADRNPAGLRPGAHEVTMPEAFKRSYHGLHGRRVVQARAAGRAGRPADPAVGALGRRRAGTGRRTRRCTCTPLARTSRTCSGRNGTERDKKIAQHHDRARLGRHHGADRAGRRLRRRRRPDQGDPAAGRHLAHRGRQAVHHLRRARPDREHRPPGAGPAAGRRGGRRPGHQGLSLFVVPKYHFDLETGELTGERNGVFVTNVEKKMGIKVSTTCELTFGDGVPAKGWLLGEVHDGIAQMFQVIEYARMMVGTKAIATLSTGYLNALEYAKERVQGADLTQPPTRPRRG